MKSKTRYNVRLATRKQVRVEVAAADAAHGAPLDGWYALYRDTALRHRITAHSHAYFQVLFELAAGSESDRSEGAALFLISAHYQGELLGGIVLSTCGGGARYLYGASSPRHRKVMPNYALQWAAMQLARERGCHTYDLYGIPPAADPQHPWYGLYRLKTGFGGQVVHWCGCWDVPVRQLRYRLYRQAEALRQRYYRQLRPRLMLARR